MGHIELRDESLTGRASRLAARLGTTEEEAIAKALLAYEASLDRDQPMPDKRKDFTAWVERYHRENPLPPSTRLKADKAFYDSLNDEEDD
jgi:antitoxin VapB